MRKVKHYWGFNRKGRGLRRSLPRWIRMVVTFTETYNPSITNFLERWAPAVAKSEPDQPMVIYAIDKDTGVEGLYEVRDMYPTSMKLMPGLADLDIADTYPKIQFVDEETARLIKEEQ